MTSEDGGKVAALAYRLIETAKMSDIIQLALHIWVFTQIANQKNTHTMIFRCPPA